jgi:hypothetical protein
MQIEERQASSKKAAYHLAVLFAATILAARKLSELEAHTDAISKAEEIMRKIEKNYPMK